PVPQIFPALDRVVAGHALQAAAQAEQTEVRVRGERGDDLGNEPRLLQEHVVLPRRDEIAGRFREAAVRTSQFMRVVFVHPAKMRAPPPRLALALEIARTSL